MILNEPENSLHPDLLAPLARLIIRASKTTQIWVVSHSRAFISILSDSPNCSVISLEKVLGETRIAGQKLLDTPPWNWPD